VIKLILIDTITIFWYYAKEVFFVSKGVLHMDPTSIVMVVALVSIFSFLFVTVSEVMRFKLKKEQIKADVLIKTEEIRAKNQLDIEKLIQQDKVNRTQSVNYAESNSNQDEVSSERRNRLNERM